MVEKFQNLAIKLRQQGYFPLRLEPKGKMPKSTGWQTHTPTEESILRDFARPSNIGIRTGDIKSDNTCLIAVDVDIEEIELIKCVERAIGEKVPCKRGKKGYTYLFRIDRQVKTHKIYWTRKDDSGKSKKKPAIDVLCRGAQTVIPPSVHPETNEPYKWLSGQSLEETPYETLPVLGTHVLDEIRGFGKNEDDPIYALNDMEWLGVGGGGNTHDTCLAAVASMVARKWTDEDIQSRVVRAKKEACETAGMPYDWPESFKIIQEWIDSSRDKKFDTLSKSRVSDVPLKIINRYVYVTSIDRMYDMEKGYPVNQSVFDNVHSRTLLKPWKTVIQHPDLRIVDKLTYAPGEPKFCKEKNFDSESILDCLNIWYDAGVEPAEGDVEPFLDLVRDLFDHDERAIDHVLCFFAYIVQNPGHRVNHALVIQGEQGIGKDSLIMAFEKLLGSQNVSQVTLQHVESAFNEWLFGKQLIVFQEMLAAGRRSVYNKLKTYITDPIHTINTKHVSLQRIPNKAVYIFLTNYRHALSVDPSDRRMWVWYSEMERQSPEYYDRYYNWLSDKRSMSHLMHYLLEYDVEKFNPAAPPPMTKSKEIMIDASTSEIEQFLRQAAENETWPMVCDLVSTPHVLGAVRSFMRTSSTMVTEALNNICGTESVLKTRPRFGSSRLRVRAIRNLDKWKEASSDELRNEYMMPLPPQSGETEGSYMEYSPDEKKEDERY